MQCINQTYFSKKAVQVLKKVTTVCLMEGIRCHPDIPADLYDIAFQNVADKPLVVCEW